MRHYGKVRLVLFSLLLGVAVYATAAGYAADAAADGAKEHKGAQKGVFSLIMDNVDPVFVIIAGLSVAGVTLIIQGFIKARRSVMIPEASVKQIREMITNKQFKELLEFTEKDPSFVSKALNPALKRAPSFVAMKEAMETAVGEETADQFRKIEYLNIIGNLGPLLGLMGTVLGMIESFQSMSEAEGAADPKVLSAGISKALAHTFLGLALALPCLACFGILRTLIDRLTVKGALIAEELLMMTRPQEVKPAATAAVAVSPRPSAPVAAGGGSAAADADAGVRMQKSADRRQ
jgi:biopolymer transport protein ExbB